MMIVTPQAMTLTGYGKPASPPSHSPWKTLRVSHRLTASTTDISALTSYRGTLEAWHPRCDVPFRRDIQEMCRRDACTTKCRLDAWEISGFSVALANAVAVLHI